MSRLTPFFARRAGTLGAVAAIVLYAATALHAQEGDEIDLSPASAEGRIDFDAADLPPATVEVDLSQGMFGDLFGIGDAAIAGVSESLLQSAKDDSSAHGTRMAAEQLAAARQVIQLAADVVREVRVRVYDELPENSSGAEEVAARFDEQLRNGNWENAVRVREDDSTVRVSVHREEGAVRGIFVVAGERDELVLVNIVCDVSPENIKKFTSAATKIGLENGLAPLIESKMRELNQRRGLQAPPRTTHDSPAK
jgi:hypothetical protein